MKSATEKFLEPELPDDLGNAILHLTCHIGEEDGVKKIKHFIAEVYEKAKVIRDGREIEELRAPRMYKAATFLRRRAKDIGKELQRKGIFHPIWELPLTYYSIALVQHAWKGEKVISEMAKPIFSKIHNREFLAERNAKTTALFKEQQVMPYQAGDKSWFDIHDEYLAELGNKKFGEPLVLSPYQKVASYNECLSKGYGLLCDPGTGKTCMMIRKLDYTTDKAESDGRKSMILILCPKSVRHNWKNELIKFSRTFNQGKMYVCTLSGGNPIDRAMNFMTEISPHFAEKHIVLIAGYEAFVQTTFIHDKFEWDLCLLDESDNIASPSIKRTKTLLKLRDVFASRVIATGTPFRNTPFDIWAQLEFLGEGYSDFQTYNDFKEFYGTFVPGNSQGSQYQKMKKLEGFQNIPLLQEKLAKHTFIIRKEEALPQLPKKTFSTAYCPMTAQQAKVYSEVAIALFAELESFGPEPDTMTLNNHLTKMLRLAQISSGYAATDNNGVYNFDPNPKLELLVRIVIGTEEYRRKYGNIESLMKFVEDDEDLPGICTDPNRKFIVWTCFKENIRAIRSRLSIENIKTVDFHGGLDDDTRSQNVNLFNKDRETKGFIGIAASGGVGLNLVGFDSTCPSQYETNCTDTINYSSNWSSRNRLQAMDRAHRHNTRVPVHITDLLCENTIDEEIYDRVQGKVSMSMSLQDIRNVLRSRIPTVVE